MLCISRQRSADFEKKQPIIQTIKGRISPCAHKDSLALTFSLPGLDTSNCWLMADFIIFSMKNILHLGSAHRFNTI